MKLARVIVFTRDVSRLAAFYEQVLGLARVPGGDDGWCELERGGCRVAFHRGPPAGPGRKGPKLVFASRDVARTRDELKARGAKMGKLRAFGDLHLCDGRDPDGNPFQISNRV